jgi:hypothetical protein
MKIATIRSVCECQARLEADLDENRHVLRGSARDARRGRVETAPAHSIGADRAQFQVAWLCPFCIRNQLRPFDAGGLSYHEQSGLPAAPTTS